MERRKFLKSVALTGATGLILPGINLFGNGQSQQSKGRKSPLDGIRRENIKITDIKVRLFSYPIPIEKWWYGCGVEALTEIYTDKGIVGIGGPSNYGGVEDIKKYTEQTIRPALLGQNPFDVDLITGGGPKFNMPVITSRSFTQSCAWAGVNTACWDIIGKGVGKPVYQLLATDHKPNPHIEHYASAGTLYDWSKRPEDLYDEALGYKQEGFKSFKFRLGDNFEKLMTVEKYIPFLRKLREKVGPDFRLMQESNMRLTLEQCLQLVPVLDELNFVWFEEPINRWGTGRRSAEGIKEAIEGHLKIRKAAKKLLITGGETMQNQEEFREWIDSDAYDIVQPDCDTTGITEGWNIALMANARKKPCVPHNWHGGLTWMANIQLVAGIPNQLILESNRNFNPFREGLFTEPIVVKNSYADAPSKPGLGVEIIPDADKKFPYDPKNDWRNMKR
jgi:L-alanine-DL-glutamate epimerase-like enolase superfamily enzyme